MFGLWVYFVFCFFFVLFLVGFLFVCFVCLFVFVFCSPAFRGKREVAKQ